MAVKDVHDGQLCTSCGCTCGFKCDDCGRGICLECAQFPSRRFGELCPRCATKRAVAALDTMGGA